jgi:hypothetical protein
LVRTVEFTCAKVDAMAVMALLIGAKSVIPGVASRAGMRFGREPVMAPTSALSSVVPAATVDRFAGTTHKDVQILIGGISSDGNGLSRILYVNGSIGSLVDREDLCEICGYDVM